MITVPKKVLIVKLNRLGDTVAFLPTINAIRKGLPDSHLTLLTTNIGKELIDGTKLVDEIWVDEIKNIRTLKGMVRWMIIFRRNHFDIAIASSDSSSFIALLFFLSSIPTRIGFANPKLSFLFNRRIPYSTRMSHLELNLQIAKVLGIPFDNHHPYPDIAISEKEKEEINKKFPEGPFVVLHIGSWRPSRRWFVDRYAEIVRFLYKKYPMKTVCIGGEPERDLISSLKKMVEEQVIIDLCCQTNVKQLVYLISLSKLFIGHSSGPLHIAFMVGTPSVSLWGASSLTIWGPVFDKEKHICIKADLDCLHCEQVVCPKGTLECMDLIKTDIVKTEISKLLEKYNGKNWN